MCSYERAAPFILNNSEVQISFCVWGVCYDNLQAEGVIQNLQYLKLSHKDTLLQNWS